MTVYDSWKTELATLRENPVVSTKTSLVDSLAQDFVDSLLAELKRSNARNRDLRSDLESMQKYDQGLKAAFDNEQDIFWIELQKTKSSLFDYSIYADGLRDKVAKLEAQLKNSAVAARDTSTQFRSSEVARNDEWGLLERIDVLEGQLERNAFILFEANAGLERSRAEGEDTAERFRLETLALKSHHAEEVALMQHQHRVECEEIREMGEDHLLQATCEIVIANEENLRLSEQLDELRRNERMLRAALESEETSYETNKDLMPPSQSRGLRRRASTDDCWPGVADVPTWIDKRLRGYSARLLDAETDIATLKEQVEALQGRAMNVDRPAKLSSSSASDRRARSVALRAPESLSLTPVAPRRKTSRDGSSTCTGAVPSTHARTRVSTRSARDAVESTADDHAPSRAASSARVRRDAREVVDRQARDKRAWGSSNSCQRS